MQHSPYGELEPQNPRMSEDCLYLNVWTPATSTSEGLPVVVWVHGGEFFAGSGSEPRYDGTELAALGIVVVTFNYRLGIFGFFSHPELSVESGTGTSGNYGLLDMIAALDWVRDHISAFGGDPGNVTLAGESAGSCVASAFMAASAAAGKFQRVIAQSCSLFMPEPHAMNPLTLAQSEERGLGFQRIAGAASLADMRRLPAETLLDIWLRQKYARFLPCTDGHILPQDIKRVFSEGKQQKLPLLIGWNAEESGYLRAMPERLDLRALHEHMQLQFGSEAGRLWQTYLSLSGHDEFSAAVLLLSDRTMAYPTWSCAEAHASFAPTYLYRFDRAPPGSPRGACHASEIEYVFGTLKSKDHPWTEEDWHLSNLMGRYWANFARCGDPNGSGLALWPPYDVSSDRRVNRLNLTCESLPSPDLQRLRVLKAAYDARNV